MGDGLGSFRLKGFRSRIYNPKHVTRNPKLVVSMSYGLRVHWVLSVKHLRAIFPSPHCIFRRIPESIGTSVRNQRNRQPHHSVIRPPMFQYSNFSQCPHSIPRVLRRVCFTCCISSDGIDPSPLLTRDRWTTAIFSVLIIDAFLRPVLLNAELMIS